jgi:hypothetical protein
MAGQLSLIAAQITPNAALVDMASLRSPTTRWIGGLIPGKLLCTARRAMDVPDTVWVTDITYNRNSTKGGRICLSSSTCSQDALSDGPCNRA